MAKAAAKKAPTKSRKSVAQDQPLPAAVYVETRHLKEWVRNPRENDDAIPRVMESIKEFGFGAPIIARRANGEVIAGHTRLKAAIKLGLKTVPVRYLDLTEKKAHQLALADNKLGEIATWNDAELLRILGDYAPDERLIAGWGEEDMKALERAVTGASDSGAVTEDEPGPVPKVPITTLGDIWQLGRHRLICGDSTDPAVISRLLEGRKVGLMATDPPYGVKAIGGTRDPRDPNYKTNGRQDIDIANDDLDPDQLEGFLRRAFEAALPAMAPGASWYVWSSSKVVRPVMQALDVLGGYRHELVWVKSNFVFGRCDYHYRHEPCLYGWTPGAGHTWLGTRDQSSVVEVPLDKAVGELVHPSVKPVELYAIPIRNHLGADGAVLDPFSGTGPAFSAAEQLGRTCYGVELDPGYCDVIVARWEALTGDKGVRLDRRPGNWGAAQDAIRAAKKKRKAPTAAEVDP
jgi:site-specific DNA-methyltransferase (adenine-specific)